MYCEVQTDWQSDAGSSIEVVRITCTDILSRVMPPPPEVLCFWVCALSIRDSVCLSCYPNFSDPNSNYRRRHTHQRLAYIIPTPHMYTLSIFTCLSTLGDQSSVQSPWLSYVISMFFRSSDSVSLQDFLGFPRFLFPFSLNHVSVCLGILLAILCTCPL